MLLKRLASLAWSFQAGQAPVRGVRAVRRQPPGLLTRLRQAGGGDVLRAGSIEVLRAGHTESAGHYSFLVGRLIDAATLRRAEFFARRWRTPVHEVLIAQGWVGERDYVRALAEQA